MLPQLVHRYRYVYMPAEHHIGDENNLIIATREGDVSVSEFIDVPVEYQKNIQTHPGYIAYHEIFDLSNAAKLKMTVSGLMSIGLVASSSDHLFTHKKLA